MIAYILKSYNMRDHDFLQILGELPYIWGKDNGVVSYFLLQDFIILNFSVC